MSILFVGNLSEDVTETLLEEFFRSVRYQVEGINLVRDRYTAQPRGYAFVRLPEETDIEKAVGELNGQYMEGRRLTVAEARPQRFQARGRTQARRRRDGRLSNGYTNSVHEKRATPD